MPFIANPPELDVENIVLLGDSLCAAEVVVVESFGNRVKGGDRPGACILRPDAIRKPTWKYVSPDPEYGSAWTG